MAKVEFLKREMEHASDEARGQSVQAGFKVFHKLMFQLHPDFNMRVVKAFITPEVMEEVVAKVKEKVAISWRGALRVASTNRKGGDEIGVSTRALEVIKVEDIDESWCLQ